LQIERLQALDPGATASLNKQLRNLASRTEKRNKPCVPRNLRF